jgi:signal transduction histidine kinase
VGPPLGPRLQERGATSRRGIGLGLRIVRRVMELHGGHALLARNGADGATFRLVLMQEPGPLG